MKCPSCQTGNPEKAKFCIQCGNKLEIICPKCCTGNSPSFKFCMECGHGLSFPAEPSSKELSFDEKIERIQKYLPGGLAERILSQRDKIEGEKKQVTVLFADLEGFTPLVEKIGPEEAYSIMDEVYEILIHKVHDYEGTVNEMTGDGIMALFGAPIALEDAPQRAIQSAYAIHREMVRFRDGLKQEKECIPPLKMRIGIHTGPVVVGTLGNDLRVEFKAVGDTVNQASRVEGLAEPGATYVTEETFKLTEGLFRFEALGEKAVKGKEEPIRVYRVIAPTTRRTRFDVSAERGLTPIVGRERELELLLDGFERCKLGRGEAFSIMAEAGVGKSRLLYEFRKAVANEDVTFLEGKCLSYSRNVAYHPITDILKANFDIRDGNADFEIREKVSAGLRNLGADEASTLPYILELLSLKDSGIDKVPLSFEEKNDRITKALKWIVLKNSQIRPLIMAIEDLHWIDKSSEKFLKDISDSIQGAKVLLLFTYRPEFLHTWGGKSHHTQVNLNLLSKRETLKMVTILLNAEAIDKGLEDLILKKTEGVPFFIEEFIRSFNDLRIIKREDRKCYLAEEIQGISIPSTIQDVITSRVDSLPQKAKKVLQAGSAIEREFAYEIINRVTDLSENDLLSSLSVLKDSDLVFERGIFPESSYVFRHALTQEIVYDSILSEKKKRLHENIGNSIVELYKNRIEEHYEILAEHFVIAENYEKGAHYSKLASKKAEKAGFFNDSIFYLKKRIACLEKLPQTNKIQEQIVDTRVVLGIHYTTLNHHVVSKQCVDPIVNLTRKLGLQNRISQIATILGSYYIMVEEN